MDISVYITSDLTSSERRISPQWSLFYLKEKIEHTTGIEPQYQTLQYYPNQNDNQFIIISDSRKYDENNDKNTFVSDLNIIAYSRIHVEDGNSNSITAQLAGRGATKEEEEAAAFKYSEEEYAKRDNTVLSWKKTQKLGRFDPDFQSMKERETQENELASENIKVGDRCRTINIQGERRGTVKYVGKIAKLDKEENIWVGIEFDEPVGKNSGSIDNERIFECKLNHGSFLKPKQVEVGDFPEIDPFASDDDDDEL